MRELRLPLHQAQVSLLQRVASLRIRGARTAQKWAELCSLAASLPLPQLSKRMVFKPRLERLIMMKPRHATTKLEALDLMLEAAITDHKNHESRNRQLSVIRGILDHWIPEFNSYTSTEDEERKTRPTLEA